MNGHKQQGVTPSVSAILSTIKFTFFSKNPRCNYGIFILDWKITFSHFRWQNATLIRRNITKWNIFEHLVILIKRVKSFYTWPAGIFLQFRRYHCKSKRKYKDTYIQSLYAVRITMREIVYRFTINILRCNFCSRSIKCNIKFSGLATERDPLLLNTHVHASNFSQEPRWSWWFFRKIIP